MTTFAIFCLFAFYLMETKAEKKIKPYTKKEIEAQKEIIKSPYKQKENQNENVYGQR